MDVAPRISDREIIEKLAGLEAGQKHLLAEINLRLEAQQKETNARFDAQQKETNARFEGVNARLDAQQRLIEQNHSTTIALFCAMMAMISGLIGFVVWDRRTMSRTLEMKIEVLRDEIVKDRIARAEDNNLLQKILEALKNLAKVDTRMAEVLRAVHLL